MTHANYREALLLLDTALALVRQASARPAADLRRQLRAVGLNADLLRARLGQPAAELRRN